MQTRIEKYRPYLTLEELELCAASVRLLPDIPEQLLIYLDRYIVDIKMKARQVNAYVLPTKMQRLELEEPTSKAYNASNDPTILYDVYISNGKTFAGMNPVQISIVKEYIDSVMLTDEELNEKMLREITEGAGKIKKEDGLKYSGLSGRNIDIGDI